MASFETLQERLTALQETTGQLRELIDRLATIKFSPGSVPLPAITTKSSFSSLGSAEARDGEDSPPNIATELAAEINQVLREEEDELDLLREEMTDLRSGRPGSEAEHRKTRLREGLQRLEDELKTCRTAFRKAQLSAHRNVIAAQKLERDLVLASLAAMRPQPPTPTNDSQSQNSHPQQHTELFSPRDRRRLAAKAKSQASPDLVTASSDVTDALRRTHALIAGEVAKSAFASQTLAESTAALKELQQNYEGLDGLLARSRELVSTLLTSQKSDTWYLRTSFYVLLGTLAWLVFRRFLYGPLWWIVWLPVRTTFRTINAMTGTLTGSVGGARMEVVDPAGGERGRRVVGVGEEHVVPTILVGDQDNDREQDDSMVESVERMVEGSLRGKVDELLNGTEVGEEADRPNPMKRMWEEDVGPEDTGDGADGRVRDEP